MGLSARTKLGPYEVVVLLGAGGIGVVYRVRDATLGRATAVRCCRRGMRRIPLAKWSGRAAAGARVQIDLVVRVG